MIRVILPRVLQDLACVAGEVLLDVPAPVSVATVLDALEARHPVLRGTIRDQVTGRRRAFLRYFACGEDISLDPPEAALPHAVATGTEPLRIIGAIAGG